MDVGLTSGLKNVWWWSFLCFLKKRFDTLTLAGALDFIHVMSVIAAQSSPTKKKKKSCPILKLKFPKILVYAIKYTYIKNSSSFLVLAVLAVR